MNKIYFIILVLFSFSFSSNAQVSYEIRQAIDFFRTNKMISGDYSKMLEESDIDGSPFLNDEFINGNIYTELKQQFVDVPLRFNIYNDQVEFKTGENKIQAIATPEIVDKIEFGEYTMFYLPFTNVKKVRKGFFILIEPGKASLFYKPQVAYKNATQPGAYQDAEPAKFIRQADIYYIKVEPGEAKLVSTKKDLVNLFPDRNKEIAAFIKKNKIKTNKVESLTSLVQYYNSL